MKRAIMLVGSVLLVFALAVGAYLLGAGRAASPVGPATPPAAAAPDPTVLGPVVASTDPVQTATAWLRGYRDQSWTDPAPWSWTTRVLPAVTGALAGEYRAEQSADGGAEWSDYVARRCVTTVSAPAGVIPGEAPRAAGEVYVQVTADALSSCAVGAAPGGAEEHLAATVELLRGPDGLWRVAQRLY
jgi:hypothetical protein